MYSFASISTILNKAYNIEDFPAPVLPTHPILSPGMIVKDISFRTKGVSSLYRKEIFEKMISPLEGHCLGYRFTEYLLISKSIFI